MRSGMTVSSTQQPNIILIYIIAGGVRIFTSIENQIEI